MEKFLKKLSSRKFWAAVAGFVAGLAIVFGLDENTISAVSGAVVSMMSVITYIITEGKVDATASDKKVIIKTPDKEDSENAN